ncbi:hypothetical protein DDB_G0271932 [Dictyostelium discoideum AX4]|uniref:Uncharacterized protein n=1 Tax=Dictyostelium discoideum TaxID=44689 RepID=Q55AD0_DICDI|nr:hypothetical protein DDB_G0271932 [Dictyostelium discoideum AX4]EAL71490.1 hypothetical protein DDB_G0271932 [Dictyostelium discoideum AX4]|eukprot:XP_645426.1 hypothetical protein DDB_G0271932 [Dictyostelium discoideum AX4]
MIFFKIFFLIQIWILILNCNIYFIMIFILLIFLNVVQIGRMGLYKRVYRCLLRLSVVVYLLRFVGSVTEWIGEFQFLLNLSSCLDMMDLNFLACSLFVAFFSSLISLYMLFLVLSHAAY